ncbi:MAG: aminotransferase class I/II-fold pyridoxal phosphate-dependent enzyme [Vicinamibacterales bacterium]
MTPDETRRLRFDSRAVYYPPDPATGAITAPIGMGSSFQYDAGIYQRVVDGERKDVNIYGRCGNPTEYQFEAQMAAIEGADACLATASGMAAVAVTLFGLLKQGDHIVCDWTTYSSTHELLDHRLTDYGITTTFVDTADLDAVAAAIRPATRLLYVETIANPSMKVADLAALAALGRDRGLLVVCDNTFASPYVARPLEWGVDLVVESCSKFIGGHNDVIGGAICVKSSRLTPDVLERIRWDTMVKWGAPLAPFNAWLLLRGIQTLPVRVERQCRTALALARHLEAHPSVRRVWYPGLPSHPQHALATRQMPDYGAMLSFDVGSAEAALRVADGLRLACFAASLGGTRTTVQIPATMAFLDIPDAERRQMGIAPGGVRVSAGLEHVDDLTADLGQALARI